MSEYPSAAHSEEVSRRSPVAPAGAPGYDIPFNRPRLEGNEIKYMIEAVESGKISGDGQFTRKCHALLEQLIGIPKVLLTTSCTSALDMAALLLEVGSGDEVVVPSFTFSSTANAFALRGARLVFADVRDDTLNIDENQVEASLSTRSRAIVAVHYAGVGCEMDRLSALADDRGVSLIEDNAHGLFGTYRGQQLGTFGRLATLSFHETRNFGCGEGGALLINDAGLVERAEIIREKGTDRSRFFRGEVDRYTWVDIGSSYLPSDLLAAVLFAQLEARDKIMATRSALWGRYAEGLAGWAEGAGVRLPVVPEDRGQAFHMFYVVMPSADSRDRLIEHLHLNGILAVFHYLPLHLSPMGLRHGGKPGDCPVTERISERLVRLPFFNGLSETDQERVITVVQDFAP